MINIIDKERCCGCGACLEICPKQCIQFAEDEEGFMYPQVDKTKCIECNLCEKVCPITSKYNNVNICSEAYGAYSCNYDERILSSSGGIFSVLASNVLDKEGVVCGAAYDEEWNVSHILVETKEQLKRLRGSKYTQSLNKGIYSLIKKKLNDGRIVLYSGTACQVAGLKKYLQKDYENLITVDILCHGVPTPKLWKKYLEEMQFLKKSRIKEIDLRNKETGWKEYSIKICFDNNEQINEKFDENYYMKMFLGNLCLRPSCHDCQYKDIEHPSDITIGDYWGIEKQFPEMDDNKGISIIKINTCKGKKIFAEISSKLVYKKVDIEVALPPTADSRKSVVRHSNREKFFQQIDKKSMEQLVKLTKTSKCRRKVRKLKKLLKDLFIKKSKKRAV